MHKNWRVGQAWVSLVRLIPESCLLILRIKRVI